MIWFRLDANLICFFVQVELWDKCLGNVELLRDLLMAYPHDPNQIHLYSFLEN